MSTQTGLTTYVERRLSRLASAWIAVVAAGGVLVTPAGAQSNTPAISSMEPAARPAGSGAFTLYVNGGNFRDNAVVRWNGADRSTTVVSEGRLRAAIPSSDLAQPGVAAVTVVTRVGQQERTSSPASFAVTLIPYVQSFAPAPALAGGEPFTLSVIGARFAPDAVVRWGVSDRPTSFVSAARLSATIPAADIAAAQNVSITVLNPGAAGGLSASRSYFVVHSAPAIGSLSPARARAGGEAFSLTVNGENFIRDTSIVMWNGQRRPTTFVSRNRLIASIRAADIGSAGNAAITVLTRPGSPSLSSTAASFTVETNILSVTGVAVMPVRLGQEALAERGQFAGLTSDRIRRLDCAGLGSSWVMVGVRGKDGWAIDELSVGCRQMLAGGTLGTTTRWTGRWDTIDNGGEAFPDQVCRTGYVVSSAEVRVDFGQIRRLTIRCKRIGATGLTSGSESTLENVGYNTGTPQGPDSCSGGRPARALRLSTAQYTSNNLLVKLAPPWIVAGLQLICEQPVVP